MLSKLPTRGQEGTVGDKQRTNYLDDESRREVGICMLMCALLRWWRQKQTILSATNPLNGKSGNYDDDEKKYLKEQTAATSLQHGFRNDNFANL